MIAIMEEKYHSPVMLDEVLLHLNLKASAVIVDATMGTGGHSLAILEKIMPGGRVIGIDRDQESMDIAKKRLEKYSGSVDFVYGNFSDLDVILDNLNVSKIDGILFDLGISSFQLDNADRGFSFQSEGPLDMRMDRNSYISAYDLLNNLNEEEIANLLRVFGQERWHNRIAHNLVMERQRHPIATTSQLTSIVMSSIPHRYRHYRHRIHPATRTFQAVRIAVNRELEALETAITKSTRFLGKGKRICVISFHSLEDRIAKLAFRKLAQEGLIKIVTPKPLTPTEAEVMENPSSRSSKFRVAERL